jgi:hypothetical protein
MTKASVTLKKKFTWKARSCQCVKALALATSPLQMAKTSSTGMALTLQ